MDEAKNYQLKKENRCYTEIEESFLCAVKRIQNGSATHEDAGNIHRWFSFLRWQLHKIEAKNSSREPLGADGKMVPSKRTY